jgi:hypothetical protein
MRRNLGDLHEFCRQNRTHLVRLQYAAQFAGLVQSLDSVDTLQRERKKEKIVKPRRHLMATTLGPVRQTRSRTRFLSAWRVSSRKAVPQKGRCSAPRRKATPSNGGKLQRASRETDVFLRSPRNAAGISREKIFIVLLSGPFFTRNGVIMIHIIHFS